MRVLKEKTRLFVGHEDMDQMLQLGENRDVLMALKHDGHYVAVYNDGQSAPMIRLRSSKGKLLKFGLDPAAIPNLPVGVELRAELVVEKQTAKSSHEQFLDTNAMFATAYRDEQAPNSLLNLRDLTEWDGCDKYAVPCKIVLHVHGLVDHKHQMNTEVVASCLEGASENIKQIEWTPVTSVQQAQERLQAEFDANHEGLMFFVMKYGPAPCAGNAKSDPDSRSCSPERDVLVGSEWIKGKMRDRFTGTVVRKMREGKVWMSTVRLDNYPLDIDEVKVRLGNTHGFYQRARVHVDVVPNSSADRRPRHVIGMGVEGASGKRKRD